MSPTGPTIETAFKILDFGSATLDKVASKAKVADASLGSLDKQAKDLSKASAGPKALKDSIKGMGDETTRTKSKIKLNMDDMKFRIAAATRNSKDSVEKLRLALKTLNETRSNPKIDLEGGAEALAMVRILKKELNSLERKRATSSLKDLGLAGLLGGGSGGNGGLAKSLSSGFESFFASGFKLAGLFSILTPAVSDFTGAIGALIGVTGGAIGGLGVGGVGILGTVGVGFAGIAAGVIPVVKGLGEGKKAFEAYNKAVEKYGRNSSQAATAQKMFENQGQYGKDWLKLHRFGREFKSNTTEARRSILGTIGKGTNFLEDRFMNTASKVTNRSAHGLDQFATAFEHGIDKPSVHRNLLILSNIFTKISPMVGGTFASMARLFLNLAVAAKPYTIEFFKWFDHLMGSMASKSSNIDRTTKAMKPLIGDLKSVANFLKQGGQLLLSFFGQGQGPGKGLLNDASAQMREWRESIEAKPSGVKDWFQSAVHNTEKIVKLTAPFLKGMNNLAEKLNAVLMPWLEMMNTVRSGVSSATGSNLLGAGAGVATGAAAYTGAKYLGKKAFGKLGGLLGKGVEGITNRGSTPANPLFVSDVGALGGVGGVGGKALPGWMTKLKKAAPWLGGAGIAIAGGMVAGNWLTHHVGKGGLTNQFSGNAAEANNAILTGSKHSPKELTAGSSWNFNMGPHAHGVAIGGTGITAVLPKWLMKQGEEVTQGKRSAQKWNKAVETAIVTGRAKLEDANFKGWKALRVTAEDQGAKTQESWETKIQAMRKATKEGFTGIFGELQGWLQKTGSAGGVTTAGGSAAKTTKSHGGNAMSQFHGKGATGMRVPGWGNADTIPLGGLAAPGELIVNKHTENDINRDLMMSGKTSLSARVAGEKRRHGDTYTSRGVSGPIMPGMATGGRYATGGNLGKTKPPVSGTTGGSGNLGSMVAEANRLNAMHLPYIWGGGHAGFSRNPGGLDCSGTVSDVLHAGGLLGSPETSGSLASWGLSGPSSALTVYANPEHTFMKLNGKFFGTSTSNPGGGPGWIPSSNFSPQYLATFSARHPSGTVSGGGRAMGAGVSPPPQLKGRTFGGSGIFQKIGQGLMNQAHSKAQAKLNQSWGGNKAGKGGGKVYSGKVSWFSGGATAGGKNTSEPGIAMNINPGSESGWDNATTDKWMQMSLAGHPQLARVSIAGHSANLPIIDKGPAGFTQRAIDVTEGGVRKLGFSTGAFPTDAMGTAQLMATGGRVPWFGKGGNFKVKRPTLIGVGDGGEEHVSVTPKGKANARSGGRSIEVNIGTVVHQREGDLAAHIRRELELLTDSINGTLSEDPAELMG